MWFGNNVPLKETITIMSHFVLIKNSFIIQTFFIHNSCLHYLFNWYNFVTKLFFLVGRLVEDIKEGLFLRDDRN